MIKEVVFLSLFTGLVYMSAIVKFTKNFILDEDELEYLGEDMIKEIEEDANRDEQEVPEESDTSDDSSGQVVQDKV